MITVAKPPKFDLMAAFQIGLSDLDKEMRGWSLGGSDANTIVNGTEDDILKLIRIKRGEQQPDDLSRNLAVIMGTFTEPLNCWLYEQFTGNEVYDRNLSIPHPAYDHFRCNLDGRTCLATGETAVFEAKHTSSTNLEAIVKRYLPQLQHNMDVAMENVAVLSVLMGSNKYDHVLVAADTVYINALRERMDVVWRSVLIGQPLGRLPDMPKPPMPEIFLKPDPVDLTTLPNANRLGVLMSTILEHADAAAKLEAAKKDFKAEAPQDAREMLGWGGYAKRNAKGAWSFGYLTAANDDEISY